MILFIFHINEDLTFCHFREKAGRLFSRALRCRYKTFLAASLALFGSFYATSRYIKAVIPAIPKVFVSRESFLPLDQIMK
jgi:hypothetical protein